VQTKAPRRQPDQGKANAAGAQRTSTAQANKARKDQRHRHTETSAAKAKRQKHTHKPQNQRTLSYCSLVEQQRQLGESIMAKGQVRSNREAKKPKQEKKLKPATSPSGAPPIRVTPSASATQKKH
jgi:hypothetical protein